MRLHTKLTESEVRSALEAVRVDGSVARSVYFDVCAFHRSRQRPAAFEIKLASWDKQPGDGRRRTNSGHYGNGADWAATYDEWGFFIAELFDRDPEAVFGNYKGRDDFHDQTKGAYHRATV